MTYTLSDLLAQRTAELAAARTALVAARTTLAASINGESS